MAFNPFSRRRNDSFNQGRAKKQQDEGDMGRVLMVSYIERGGR